MWLKWVKSALEQSKGATVVALGLELEGARLKEMLLRGESIVEEVMEIV